MSVGERYLTVLIQLAAHAPAIVSKDFLITAAWQDVAVGDNSIEQAISTLRRLLGTECTIETVPRQGYRLNAKVRRLTSRAGDDDLETLLAPHRALLDGRAALETLERDAILRARTVFTGVVTATPDAAPAHVGLANACVLQFEMTRSLESPDIQALQLAVHHAYEACRLDTAGGEAWATLGFVLERTGKHADALAAARRAIALEPDNWRHHLRLGSIAWGEERLRAARRTLALLPGLALAHWLAASVMVARQMLAEAEHELTIGIDGQPPEAGSRFSGIALHWLLGLIWLADGREGDALRAFERELDNESTGHLYARECCANTWYAIGAVRLRQGCSNDAITAFERALERIPNHGLARTGLALCRDDAPTSHRLAGAPAMDDALCQAAVHAVRGAHIEAAAVMDAALTAATLPNAAWLLPVEPLINVAGAPTEWAAVLQRIRARTA